MLSSSQTFPLPRKYPTLLGSTIVHTTNTETRVSDFASLIVKTGLIKNRDYINAETHDTQTKTQRDEIERTQGPTIISYVTLGKLRAFSEP